MTGRLWRNAKPTTTRTGAGDESGADSYGIVGAGIVGLALARELLIRRPSSNVTVLEKEAVVGAHQTGHNSGVVHAGLYYAPNSLKATLCRRGRALLREFCEEAHLSYLECGKLVVATKASEMGRLLDLQSRAEANRVPDLACLDAGALREIEPRAAGVAALHSPHTAIVDFAAVAAALAADVVGRGGRVLVGAPVSGFHHERGRVRIVHGAGEELVERVVVCAGLQSDLVARLAGDAAEPEIIPFRGEYLRLRPAVADAVHGLIYPVPDPRFPFLGVHATRRVDGNVDLGPNAVLALSREGYRRRDVDVSALASAVTSPGLRRLVRRHWRMALRETATSLSRRAFVAEARRLLPGLGVDDVVEGPSGVRAQAVTSSGDLVDDFVVNTVGQVTTVRNAPSPAATSSLAIAEHLCDVLEVGKTR